MVRLKYMCLFVVFAACIHSKVATKNKLQLQAAKESDFDHGKYYYYHFTEENIQAKWDTAALYFRKCLGNDTIKRNTLSNDEKTAFFWLAGIYFYKGNFERLNSLCKIVMHLYPKYNIKYSIAEYFDTSSSFYKNPAFTEKYASHFKKILGLQTGQEYAVQKKLLEEAFDKDQKFRKLLLDKDGRIGTVSQTVADNIAKADSINILSVSEIIKKYGWLSISDVGIKASDGEFFVIQHADSSVFLNYHPIIEQAYKEGKLSQSNYELYIDRMNVFLKKEQIYGTQQYYDTTKREWIKYPIRKNKEK